MRSNRTLGWAQCRGKQCREQKRFVACLEERIPGARWHDGELTPAVVDTVDSITLPKNGGTHSSATTSQRRTQNIHRRGGLCRGYYRKTMRPTGLHGPIIDGVDV